MVRLLHKAVNLRGVIERRILFSTAQSKTVNDIGADNKTAVQDAQSVCKAKKQRSVSVRKSKEKRRPMKHWHTFLERT
jgi:hypothetical protein